MIKPESPAAADRRQTDESLSTERALTDMTGDARIVALEQEMQDAVIGYNRLDTDKQLLKFRDITDKQLERKRDDPDLPCTVSAERSVADQGKQEEREMVDSLLQEERQQTDATLERYRHEADVHRSETLQWRAETDAQLSTERQVLDEIVSTLQKSG